MAWRRKQWLRCTKLRICKLLSAALIVAVVLKFNSILETPCNKDEMHENFKQLVRTIFMLLIDSFSLTYFTQHIVNTVHQCICY